MKSLVKSLFRAGTSCWPDYSRLFALQDVDSWVISWEVKAFKQTAAALGIRVGHPFWMPLSQNQAVFYGSQFFLLSDDWVSLPHRIGAAYFHGLPGTGVAEFDAMHEKLKAHHDRIARLQVSHSQMHDVILEAGIDPEKVHRIPIGIEPAFFSAQTPENKKAAREILGIPEQAFVVGSFQKDGAGWGDGLEPKPIKGPDVLLETLGLLKEEISELFVFISGPARGFVKAGLEERGIPYVHHYLDDYAKIGSYFHALDAYLVASRQEGGPKAVLESMASGVPLVTTRVGQAMDLVEHGVNGYMHDVDDAEALAASVLKVYEASEAVREPMLKAGLDTASRHTYEKQRTLWAAFMKGFVNAS